MKCSICKIHVDSSNSHQVWIMFPIDKVWGSQEWSEERKKQPKARFCDYCYGKLAEHFEARQ